MNKYYILLAAVFTAIAYSQGIDFPSTPTQAPIGGLGLLAAGGAALAYKKLKKSNSTPLSNGVCPLLWLK